MTRPAGIVTRGTTAPGRLRRIDTWIANHLGHRLRATEDPLVVDLGFGATPVTTIELLAQLASVAGERVRVVGLEISQERVATASVAARPPSLDFDLGGFELAGLRPTIVRAMNVLRQYDESAVQNAWATMTAALAPCGRLVEGTCDETGHLATWVVLDRSGPVSLTLSANLSTLTTPVALATRLPKALIHHNVPGEPVHALLRALERSWQGAAAYSAFGRNERWRQAVADLRADGWPVIGSPSRWHLGEVTLRWNAVAPNGNLT